VILNSRKLKIKLLKVAESNITHLIKKAHISKEGAYYFFDAFVVYEINSGIIYDWKIAQDAIKIVEEFYGKNHSIGYISNRVNNYSLKPTDWFKFYKSYYHLKSYAIISNNKKSLFNDAVERMFLNSANVERFTDLYEGINWTKQMGL